MSRSNTRTFFNGLFIFVVTLALAGIGLVVPAQNSNSSTTTQNDNMSPGSTNMGGTTRRRGGRRRGRRRRGGASMTNANAACGPMQENTNMAGSMQENANTAGSMTPRPTGRCDPNTQTQEDLSGTYTGTINYSEGGMSGDATLTINGNDFTLTSGSSTQEGRVVAVNTCNYIGVTMMFGKWQAAAPGAAQPALLTTVSLRAKKTGGGLTLMSAPGERREFSFTSSGGGNKSGGRRGRRRGKTVAIKPPTVANRMQNAF